MLAALAIGALSLTACGGSKYGSSDWSEFDEPIRYEFGSGMDSLTGELISPLEVASANDCLAVEWTHAVETGRWSPPVEGGFYDEYDSWNYGIRYPRSFKIYGSIYNKCSDRVIFRMSDYYDGKYYDKVQLVNPGKSISFSGKAAYTDDGLTSMLYDDVERAYRKNYSRLAVDWYCGEWANDDLQHYSGYKRCGEAQDKQIVVTQESRQTGTPTTTTGITQDAYGNFVLSTGTTKPSTYTTETTETIDLPEPDIGKVLADPVSFMTIYRLPAIPAKLDSQSLLDDEDRETIHSLSPTANW